MTDLKEIRNLLLPNDLKILIFEYGFRGLDIKIQLLFFLGAFGKFNKKFIYEIPDNIWIKYGALKNIDFILDQLDSEISEKI